MTKRVVGGKDPSDGDRGGAALVGTKASILEAAGQVFAEKGVPGATGKEIAQRAGVNSAAVNYYYGGVDALYADVLVEAHHRLINYDRLLSLLRRPIEPADKLRDFIKSLAGTVLGEASSAWPLRVLAREILMPSSALAVLRERELLPKRKLLMGLLGELLDLPPDDPAVTWSSLNIMAPLVILLVANREGPAQGLPFPDGERRTDEIIEHLQVFALGGLSAVAAKARAAPGRKRAPRRRRADPPTG